MATRFEIKKLLIQFVNTEKIEEIDDVFVFLDGVHMTRGHILCKERDLVLELVNEINREVQAGFYCTQFTKANEVQNWTNSVDSDETTSDSMNVDVDGQIDNCDENVSDVVDNDDTEIDQLELNVHYTEESLNVLLSNTLEHTSNDSLESFGTLFIAE